MSRDVQVRLRFNLVPLRRELAYTAARLALLVVKDPRRRWTLQYRVARIELRWRRAGRR